MREKITKNYPCEVPTTEVSMSPYILILAYVFHLVCVGYTVWFDFQLMANCGCCYCYDVFAAAGKAQPHLARSSNRLWLRISSTTRILNQIHFLTVSNSREQSFARQPECMHALRIGVRIFTHGRTFGMQFSRRSGVTR